MNGYKKLIFLFVLFLSFGLKAETVSQKDAAKIAQQFFSAARKEDNVKPVLAYNGRSLTTNRLFPPFYIYNNPKGGFVIVAAENKAFPILGYSLSENFNMEDIDESLKFLLSEYAYDIERVRYDSREPEEAIKAWQNIDGYIQNLLDKPYEADDPRISIEESREILESLDNSDFNEDLYSSLYSPQQWEDLLNEELKQKGEVAIGLLSESKIYPIIIHGKKGDFYRLRWKNYNDWLLRLSSTEIFNDYQIASLNDRIPTEEIIGVEDPFSLYNEFQSYIINEQTKSQELFEEKINPTHPVIKSIGGGRYEIISPENILMAQIYNISGSMVNRNNYRNTNRISLNLEGQPYGLYIVNLIGENGEIYGFKLLR